MDDKADPSAGWPNADVEKSPWPAKWDLYGKLYMHLTEILKRFLDALHRNKIRFDIYNLDVEELPQHLQAGNYCRIEVGKFCKNFLFRTNYISKGCQCV